MSKQEHSIEQGHISNQRHLSGQGHAFSRRNFIKGGALSAMGVAAAGALAACAQPKAVQPHRTNLMLQRGRQLRQRFLLQTSYVPFSAMLLWWAVGLRA